MTTATLNHMGVMMTATIRTVAATVLAALTIGCTPQTAAAADDFEVIGHRGAPAVMPEHSVEGYRYAASRGVPIEIDLRTLADGTLVALHDSTVDRTMTGTGKVSTLSRRQWGALRVKPAVEGGAYGTPASWGAIAAEFGGKTEMYVEVKNPADATVLAHSVKKRGLTRWVVITTWDAATAKWLGRYGMRTTFITGRYQTVKTLTYAHVENVSFSYKLTDRARYIRYLRSLGLRPVVWTVDDPAVARAVRDEGAGALLSNNAPALEAELGW